MKLQEKYKSRGFVVVVTLQNQNIKKNHSIHYFRSKKIPFMLTRGGETRVKRKGNPMPASTVFDAEGNIAALGTAMSLTREIDNLMKTRSHWLAEGREFKKLGKLVAGLGGRATYGQILKKLEKQRTKKEPAKSEAEFLMGRIQKHGESRLEEAKAFESIDAAQALESYREVARQWKGDDIGARAAKRLQELKADGKFQSEAKAMVIARQISSECDKFVHAEEFKLENPANQRISQRIRALGSRLKKDYPDSQALKKAISDLGFYGVEI